MNVQLTWEAAANVDSYILEIMSGNAVWSTPVNGLSYTTNLPTYGTEYSWRVKSVRGLLESDWSAIRTFTVVPIPAPVLVLPVNGSTLTTLTPSLSWNGPLFGENVQFDVQLVQGEDVVGNWNNLTVTAFNVPADLIEWGLTYSWRVKAHQPTSEAWSGFFTFTAPAIPAPALLTPLDYASYASPVVTPIGFSWTQVPAVANYEYVIATDANFSNVVLTGTTALTTVSYTPTAVGSYFWKVRGVNGTVNGTWSVVRHFAVQNSNLAVTITANYPGICNNVFSFFFGDPNLAITIVGGSGNFSFVWTSPDGSTSGLNNTTILNPTLSRVPTSSPFAVQTFMLTITDNVSGATGNASFILNLPSSPLVTMINPANSRKRIGTAAFDLNTTITTVNGVDVRPAFTGYTVLWKSSNDLDPKFQGLGCEYPTCPPLANPATSGLKRYEAIVKGGLGCESQTKTYYIFSYAMNSRDIFEDNNDLVFGQGSAMLVYPTIANNEIKVQAAFENKSDVQISIIDMMGREITSKSISQVTELEEEVIDLSSVHASGVYFLVLKSNGEQLVKKFIKQ